MAGESPARVAVGESRPTISGKWPGTAIAIVSRVRAVFRAEREDGEARELATPAYCVGSAAAAPGERWSRTQQSRGPSSK